MKKADLPVDAYNKHYNLQKHLLSKVNQFKDDICDTL